MIEVEWTTKVDYVHYFDVTINNATFGAWGAKLKEDGDVDFGLVDLGKHITLEELLLESGHGDSLVLLLRLLAHSLKSYLEKHHS